MLCYTKKDRTSSNLDSVRMWIRQGSSSEDGDGAEQAPVAGCSKARSGSCGKQIPLVSSQRLGVDTHSFSNRIKIKVKLI